MMPTMRNRTADDFFDDLKNQRLFSAESVQRKTEKHRKKQHLQYLALRKGIDDRRRNDVEDKIRRAAELARFGICRDRFDIKRRRIDIHSGARPQHVDDTSPTTSATVLITSK